MGAGIAQVSAAAGLSVTLVDASAAACANGLGMIKKSLDRQYKKEAEVDADAAARKVAAVLGRITSGTDAAAAVTNADLAIEAVTENLALKQKIFSAMDAAAPASCIFASNTSSLSIAAIASATKRSDRFGGLHFFNPVPMMKLLEVVRIPQTTDAVNSSLLAYGAAIGKSVVQCGDTPGFIVNRLLVPYMMEAIRMLERGDASMEDIDVSMKLGAGYPMGPFQLLDYVGLDTCKFIVDGWHKLHPENPLFNPSPLLDKMVAEGKFGMKNGQGFRSHKK